MENLEFIAQIYDLEKRYAKKRITENTELYYLGEIVQRRAGSLSGGQKQRLALAAVTLHEPRLLLLDEPTSAVDPQSRRDFWDNLFDLAENGTTILVSTHFMDEAERCHRLAILDRGHLVAEGVPRELSRGIDSLILELKTDQPRRVRSVLEQDPCVRAVTQLGTHMRIMVDRDITDPEHRLASELDRAGIPTQLHRIEGNLEDVFVVATQFHGGRQS